MLLRHYIRRGITTAALCVLAVMAFARDAEASCGDYVLMDGHSTAHRMVDPASGEHEWTDSTPCRGPQCSKAPVSDLPSVPVKIELGKKVLDLTLIVHAPACDPRVTDLEDSGLVQPVHFSAGIFRPPRHG